jgi:hydroxymethylbilane synthase
MINKLRVGTRSSKLAIAQTQIALTALRRRNTSVDCSIITINTKGDIDKRPLFTIDKKGIFEKEINEAVIRRDIDFAVHSLKDIPSDLSDKLTIASIPKRSKPNDVLVSEKKLKLEELPPGAVVGTSSLRRAIQLIRKRPDLNVKPIRGNVETRVTKLIGGEYDAVILAEAGLIRLGLEDRITERFNIKDFVPAPGQGAIAVVCRADNYELIKILKQIEDHQSKAETDAERALLTKIDGGCRFPVGAVAVSSSFGSRRRNSSINMNDGQQMNLYVSMFSVDGMKCIRLKKRGNIEDAIKLGIEMGELLVREGASDLAKGWRDAVQEWNKK